MLGKGWRDLTLWVGNARHSSTSAFVVGALF
jgi:hypothetical protein